MRVGASFLWAIVHLFLLCCFIYFYCDLFWSWLRWTVDGAPALLNVALFPCICAVVLSAGCSGLMGQKSVSSAVFRVEIVQFCIAGFVVSLVLALLGVVGWLNYHLFGVFTASLEFIDQRLVARFRTP